MFKDVIFGAAIVTVVPAGIYLVARVYGGIKGQTKIYAGIQVPKGRVFWWHTLELNLPREDVLPLAVKSLDELNRKYKLDPSTGSKFKVVARTGWWWRSTGEIIAIGVAKMPGSRTRVDVSSNPNIPESKFDWGVNEENISTIVEYIRSQVEPGSIGRDELMEPRS